MKAKKRTKRVAIRRFVSANRRSFFIEWIWRKGHGVTVYHGDGIRAKSSMTLADLESDFLLREVPAKGM